MATEQTTSRDDGEVSTGMTEDQAASELLKKWGDKDEANVDDDPAEDDDGDNTDADDEQADEATGSDRDDDAADESEESGEFEIDVAGEKFKLPKALSEQAQRIQAKAKEVEAGATRKFQEAADLRKAADLAATQAIQQGQFNQAQAQLLGDLALVKRRMTLIEQADTSQLDDSQLARLNHEYTQLSGAKQRIEAASKHALDLFTRDQDGIKKQRLDTVLKFAQDHIKDWGTDGGKRHAAYAASRGITTEDLEALALQNPRLLLVLEDAEYGHRIRNAKPAHEKRLATAPKKTLKPGAGGQSKSTAAAQAESLTSRARKTGNLMDATEALLARSKALPRRR